MLISLLMLTRVVIYGQQHTLNELFGRWRTHYKNQDITDIQFLNDTTAAYMSHKGLLRAHVNYKAEIKDGLIELKYFSERDNKRHHRIRIHNKLLNYSAFLFKSRSSLPGNADTSTKGIYVYRIVKTAKPGTEFHLPTDHDLLGKWVSKGKKMKSLFF